MRVRLTSEATDDITLGAEFYEQQEPGVGEVFIDSIKSELGALRTLAGIHRVYHGRHRYLAKRFPYAIYYVMRGQTAEVQAIMDCRIDPGSIAERLR